MLPRVRAVASVVAVVLLAGCGDGAGPVSPRSSPGATTARDTQITLEEAGLLASGELARIYGSRADPVPVRVDAERAELDGRAVWLLDLDVEVTIDGEREDREWRMWIGVSDDGSPGVLRAEEVT